MASTLSAVGVDGVALSMGQCRTVRFALLMASRPLTTLLGVRFPCLVLHDLVLIWSMGDCGGFFGCGDAVPLSRADELHSDCPEYLDDVSEEELNEERDCESAGDHDAE